MDARPPAHEKGKQPVGHLDPGLPPPRGDACSHPRWHCSILLWDHEAPNAVRLNKTAEDPEKGAAAERQADFLRSPVAGEGASGDQLELDRVGERPGTVGRTERAEPVVDVPGGVLALRRFHRDRERGERVDDQGRDQIIEPTEIVVDRRGGDLQAPRDGAQRESCRAALGHQASRCRLDEPGRDGATAAPCRASARRLLRGLSHVRHPLRLPPGNPCTPSGREWRRLRIRALSTEDFSAVALRGYA